MKQAPAPSEVKHGEATSSLWSRIEILRDHEAGVEALVPVDLIYREDVPVNQEHVAELTESIRERAARVGSEDPEKGQLAAIILGEVAGRDSFLIIDGFHRDAALHAEGTEKIRATIVRDLTLDEVVDMRIMTANTHAAVTFARLTEWVQDAWEKSPWHERITAAQAFSLTASRTSGKKMGLTAEEAEAVKTWAEDKCTRWKISPGSIYEGLSTAQVVDPELVHQARQRTGKKALKIITPEHLKVIGKGLPRQYAIQRVVADLAIANNFSVGHTHKAVERFANETSTIEEARALAESTDWSKLKPTPKRQTRKKPQPAQPEKVRPTKTYNPEAYRELLISELEVVKLSLENRVLRGKYIVPSLQGESTDFTPAIINYGRDKRIAAELSTEKTHEIIDAFVERTEITGPTLLKLLSKKVKLGEQDAHTVLNEGISRMRRDIATGGLRFIKLEEDTMFDRLLQKCVMDQLRTHAAPSPNISSESSSPVDEAEPLKVDLKTTLQTLSQLDSPGRRTVAMSNFMRLGPSVIAQLLEIDPEDALQLAQGVNVTLEKTTAGTT